MYFYKLLGSYLAYIFSVDIHIFGGYGLYLYRR